MVIELIWGLLCGSLVLIPGVNVGVVMLCTVPVQGSSVYALFVGLILESIVNTRISSNNLYGAIYNYRFEGSVCSKRKLSVEVIKWKIVSMIFGVILGLIFPPVIGGIPFLTIVLSLIVMCEQKEGSVWLTLVWLLGVQGLVHFLSHINGSGILLIGTMLYTIPTCFNYKSRPAIEGGVGGTALAVPSFGSILVSTFLSILSPGVSPNLISTYIDSKSRCSVMSSYMNALLCNFLIESFAVGQLIRGNSIGKSLLSIYSNYITIYSLLGLLVVISISVYVGIWVNNIYPPDVNPYIVSLVGVVTLVVVSGIWAPVLGAISIGVYFLTKRLALPPSIQGLSYVALVL